MHLSNCFLKKNLNAPSFSRLQPARISRELINSITYYIGMSMIIHAFISINYKSLSLDFIYFVFLFEENLNASIRSQGKK